MYPQIACIIGCILTLVAFVWLFSNVCFKMCEKLSKLDVSATNLDRVPAWLEKKQVGWGTWQYDYVPSHAGNLRIHLKTHSEEKSNKCNQYNFASSQAGDFRRHLKTHFGEKSNKYNQCDFASTQAGNLRIHLITHSGEKSNKCNQCNITSTWPANMWIHSKSHSGKKS